MSLGYTNIIPGFTRYDYVASNATMHRRALILTISCLLVTTGLLLFLVGGIQLYTCRIISTKCNVTSCKIYSYMPCSNGSVFCTFYQVNITSVYDNIPLRTNGTYKIGSVCPTTVSCFIRELRLFLDRPATLWRPRILLVVAGVLSFVVFMLISIGWSLRIPWCQKRCPFHF